VRRQGVQHGWVGRLIIEMLDVHFEVAKGRPPITEAALLA
jgi:hypothetical protein